MKNISYFYIGSIFYIRWFGENFFSKRKFNCIAGSWSYFDFIITSIQMQYLEELLPYIPVLILFKSSISLILLVANLSKALANSSLGIPIPSSTTMMFEIPPFDKITSII